MLLLVWRVRHRLILSHSSWSSSRRSHASPPPPPARMLNLTFVSRGSGTGSRSVSLINRIPFDGFCRNVRSLDSRGTSLTRLWPLPREGVHNVRVMLPARRGGHLMHVDVEGSPTGF